ncbi:MAG TPA: hypothetical protein PK467_03800, partial [Candidatus Wallbacteria bacterium]|nr:hypothetical protein [Candidatus Wallbacteria bacterium]
MPASEIDIIVDFALNADVGAEENFLDGRLFRAVQEHENFAVYFEEFFDLAAHHDAALDIMQVFIPEGGGMGRHVFSDAVIELNAV